MMSINVSSLQLQDATFSQTVLNALKDYELEITESYGIYDSTVALSTLSWLRGAGVKQRTDKMPW
ncbi:hypothetical protein [Paenibacillus sp. LHD-38]|uniref:hypothetical protein n=1 Tax=Paenibacillus sp. LHD-38 TaxID=3072143 RepID=UPI00280D419E|nr:hypothetical protein [Paenibacillus sp. LHD-38]MDQ8736133.1 hypothetical protein [Paenibacillus sp. LHD-38]